MAVETRPKPTPVALLQRPELRVAGATRRRAQLHLFTYVLGSALFWTLWAGISVAADRWYWWPVVPFAGWAVVLAGHLLSAYRPRDVLTTSSGGWAYRSPAGTRRHFAIWPTTRLGTWAVGLTAASVVLLAGWSLMGRLGGIPGLAFGFAGGVVGLVAIFRRGERAVTVVAALLPFLNVVVFVLAELLIGHD